LAFGLLHLPGMTGVNAIKIVALTGLSSLLFCLAYLPSGSLWMAVGLHAGMNFMLHSVLGAGGDRGPSLLKPIYTQTSPVAYDAAFWSLMVVQFVFAIALLMGWHRHPPMLPRNRR
ncbi:MAG: CPBP family intramembrane metalloprotease, partial [Sphingomonas sp.]|nr:CPBP family intramembrane metalloprotease [Sphingomonas sp.]